MNKHKRSPLSVHILESLLVTVGGEARDTDDQRQPFNPDQVDDDLSLERPDPNDLDLRNPLNKTTVNEGLDGACDVASIVDCAITNQIDRKSSLKEAGRLIKSCAESLLDEDSDAIIDAVNDYWDAKINESGADCIDPEASDDDLTGDLLQACVDLLSGTPVIDTSEEGAAEAVTEARRRAARRIQESDGCSDDPLLCNDPSASDLAALVIDADKDADLRDPLEKVTESQRRKRIQENADDPYQCTDLSADELASLVVDGDDPEKRDPLEKVTEGRRSSNLSGRLLEAFTHFAPDLIYTPEEDITTGRGETAISIASKGHALHIDGRPSHDVNSYLARSADHEEFIRGDEPFDRPDVDIGVDDDNDGYRDLHESMKRIRNML